MTDLLRLVAEPRRRDILRLVWEDEKSAGEIAATMDVTFSAVSQHLAKLRAAGLVTVRRDGRLRYYRADRIKAGPLAPLLESMWNDRLGALKRVAEAENRSRR